MLMFVSAALFDDPENWQSFKVDFNAKLMTSFSRCGVAFIQVSVMELQLSHRVAVVNRD